MPQQNRAIAGEPSEVVYRCGSQSGRVARHLSADATQQDLDAATLAFVVQAIEEFRALRTSRQKNPSRNLKKYFDRDDIAAIDQSDEPAEQLAARLVQR